MGAIVYKDGSYHCAVCQVKLRIPGGAQVRRGYTTLHDGERLRLLYVDGVELHRCPDVALDELL